MANVNLQRTSWGYGELDSRMLGRTDLPTYKQGLVKMDNWLLAKSGAAVMRGGTEAVRCLPTTFEADLIIPLRGGESPMLGLYNSTDQTFRAIKADGTWVGTEAAPAEVSLVDSVTMTESDTDATEPYYWSPASASERTAMDAFYDTLVLYGTRSRAGCFTIKLTVGANSQSFSVEGGTFDIQKKVVATGEGAMITLTPPRTDAHIIDAAIAGNETRYIEKVVLKRTTVLPDSPIVAANVELYLDDDPTSTGGSGHDIGPWESGGTLTLSFNDEPGVLPLWAIEPNVAYDEVVVRLFRPNADVKVFKVTDTTITEGVHTETVEDLVGPVTGGKHASHGAYFEQRIIYGGGRNHRQEIVGSRSPDPQTGLRRYGNWELSDTVTTSVEETTVQLFDVASVAIIGDPAGTDGRIVLDTKDTLKNMQLVDGFGTENRTLHRVALNYTDNYGGSVGHLQLHHGEQGDTENPISGSDLAAATEVGLRVAVVQGSQLSVEIPFAMPTDATTARDNTDPYNFYTSASAAADARLLDGELNELRSMITELMEMDPAPEPGSFTIKYEIGATKSTSVTNVNADNAFQWVIDTGTTFAEVRWLQAFSGVLVVGTSAGVSLCKFLNPDDPPEIRNHSSQCCSRKPPLVTPLGILAVSADQTSVYEVIRKRDLTVYSEDRFRKDKIHAIAWQQQPIQRLWVVTEAGKIHVLTIQEENGVNGWSQITHQHSATCTGVVVTNGDDEDDTVWFLMKHGAQSYVEKYRSSPARHLRADRVFMDSAVKRKVGVQILSLETSKMDAGGEGGSNYIAFSPGATEGLEVDNKLSAIFLDDAADTRLLGSLIIRDAESTGLTDDNQVSAHFNGDLDATFITTGKITVRHTSPLTGAVTHTLDIPMAGSSLHASAYLLTNSDLVATAANGNVATFVANMRALYPNGNDIPGSANFEIEISTPDITKIAIPPTMVGVTGKKLHVTNANAGGSVDEIAKYETADSPSTTSLTTNFANGDEVWVGLQVIGDMELPAIEQSISQRAVGSWLGQPARIPWVVAGAELAHSVKIGPTYDKLVEYFADTTTLSVTSALITDASEPYSWTPSNSAEVIAWLAAVKALHPVANDATDVNMFSLSLTAGGVTESFVPNIMDVGATSITFNFVFRAGGTHLSSLIVADEIDGGAVRHVANFTVTNAGLLTMDISETGAGGAGHDLSAAFESGGTVTMTRTANAPLTTGHERRAMSQHVTTTVPTVIRKDTPSPCTMTYMVVEATVG